MKRIITVSAVAVLTALLAVPVVAGGRGGKGKHKQMKKDRIMKVLYKLDLSPEQRAAVDSIHEEARAEAEPIHKQIRELEKEVRLKWDAASPDEKAIISLHKQVHDLKGDLAELRIGSRIDTLAVLTPEQREKLTSLRAGRKAKRAERRANGKGKRSGKKGRGKGYGKGMSVDPSSDSRSRFGALVR